MITHLFLASSSFNSLPFFSFTVSYVLVPTPLFALIYFLKITSYSPKMIFQIFDLSRTGCLISFLPHVFNFYIYGLISFIPFSTGSLQPFSKNFLFLFHLPLHFFIPPFTDLPYTTANIPYITHIFCSLSTRNSFTGFQSSFTSPNSLSFTLFYTAFNLSWYFHCFSGFFNSSSFTPSLLKTSVLFSHSFASVT